MQASYEHISTSERSFRVFLREDLTFPFQWHYHPEYELTLILGSRGQRLIGDCIEEYAAGDLVLVGPNLPHTWRSDKQPESQSSIQSAIVVQFQRTFLGSSFFDVPEASLIKSLLERSTQGISFSGTKQGLKVSEELRKLPALAAPYQMITLLSALQQLAEDPVSRVLSSLDHKPSLRLIDEQRIDRVCTHVENHFHETLRLSEMAKMAAMNPAAFCRFFKQSTGHTFVNYVNERRVSHACRLLIETDYSATRIGLRVGYNSHAHFNRQFRQLKGLSPGQFRRRLKHCQAVT